MVYAEEARVGDPCPEIILPDIRTGEETNLNEVSKGKVTVIVYMQTSDARSKQTLNQLTGMVDIVPDLNVIGISVDAGSPARIKKYIDHYKFPFTFLHDPTLSTAKLFGIDYGSGRIVLDKAGDIYIKKIPWHCDRDERTLFELVQDASADKEGFMRGVLNGGSEAVKKYLNNGAIVFEKRKYGNTALMMGARGGHKDAVKVLIDYGVDLNAKNKNGQSALSLAKSKGRTEIVEILLKAGAKE
ncbi:ankyrin repeat domain-containing protein [Thermodesulfobacteriota bacterium]